MNNDNTTISKLYAALSGEMERREPFLKLQISGSGDRQRQSFAPIATRYFITVLDNHIMEATVSVILTIALAEDYCILRFCKPVTLKEHVKLEAAGYAPVLRSKVYLSVGLGQSGGVLYAWSAVKLSQSSSVIEMFDMLFLLGKELEKFLGFVPSANGCSD
ncbi:MAG: hypothetical protein LBS19_09960 [Clostridiales bacterium]|nr:hypothetical protein [Clostridiales bacterium]